MPAPTPAKPWYRHLYAQVLVGVVLGVLVGGFFPDTGKALKPLGDGFIKLVKMMIARIGPVLYVRVIRGRCGNLGFHRAQKRESAAGDFERRD